MVYQIKGTFGRLYCTQSQIFKVIWTKVALYTFGWHEFLSTSKRLNKRFVHSWATCKIKWWCLDCCLICKKKIKKLWHQFLVKHRIVQMQHPLHSPDPLALFLNWKLIPSIRFENVEDIKSSNMVQLHTISNKDFHRYYHHWKTPWKSVECQRDYFEENQCFLHYSFV